MKPKQYEDQLKDLLDRVEGMSGEELCDMVDFTLRSIRPEDRGQENLSTPFYLPKKYITPKNIGENSIDYAE
jgi:hypothetical protein